MGLQKGTTSMKNTNLRATEILVLALSLTLVVPAQEKRLKKSDLPPAVQKTADEQSQGAIVKGYASEKEKGRVQYEVELMANGHTKDVTISRDGSVLEIEEEVSFDALPEAVRQGLQREAGTGKIGKVESITKRGSLVAYEAQVTTAGTRSEVQVGPDGRALAHPEGEQNLTTDYTESTDFYQNSGLSRPFLLDGTTEGRALILVSLRKLHRKHPVPPLRPITRSRAITRFPYLLEEPDDPLNPALEIRHVKL